MLGMEKKTPKSAPEGPKEVGQTGDAFELIARATDAEAIKFVPKSQNNGVALALGGGAARGWAHIGVLKAFDEAQIPISMIAGTSIGALVGGCYLAGKLPELEAFACSLTKTNILRYMDFSLRNSGLISGTKLAEKMIPHLGHLSIEDLDRPFVAVATDIRNGHEVWLHDGPLIHAIRSSYALPGVFQPIMHNGRLLVDGALVNPVPVSACRMHETQAVIAVNLNSETFGKGTVIRESHYDPKIQSEDVDLSNINSSQSGITNWLPFVGQSDSPSAKRKSINLGLTGIMMEAFNIIQDRIARSRLAGDPPDYNIRPQLKHIGMAEFHRAEEAIALGLAEGRRRITEFSALRESVCETKTGNPAF